MNVLLMFALAVPLGCLAVLTSVALLGVLALAGAVHLAGTIGAGLSNLGRGTSYGTVHPVKLRGEFTERRLQNINLSDTRQ